MPRALVSSALVPRTLVPRLHPCQGGRIENPGTDQGIPDGTSRDPVSECQDLYADETMSQLEKMESLLPYIQRWIQNEPQNPLKRSFLPNDETTFGQIKARLMVLCTCTVDDDKAAADSKETCFWHCPSPCINDIIYEITLNVFEWFGDEFTCFANLATDLISKGC